MAELRWISVPGGIHTVAEDGTSRARLQVVIVPRLDAAPSVAVGTENPITKPAAIQIPKTN